MRKLITAMALLVAFVGTSQTVNAISFTDPLLPVNTTAVVVQAPKKEVKKQVTVVKTVPETPKVVTYVVQDGDSLSTIAEKNNISLIRIWQKNTQIQNQDQLKVNDTVTIPANDETLAERPLIAPVSDSTSKVVSVTTSTPTSSYRASGGINAYDYGWCTWWAKEKRPDISGYWGDAGYSWISEAKLAGFGTGDTPIAGAIGVTAGHVVYVESVSGDTVNISEMGWGYVANSTPHYRSVPASSFTYIY